MQNEPYNSEIHAVFNFRFFCMELALVVMHPWPYLMWAAWPGIALHLSSVASYGMAVEPA